MNLLTSNEPLSTDNDVRPKVSWKVVIPIQLLVFITILVTVVFTFMGVFPFDSNLGIYRILPGNILFDFMWLYVLSLLIGIVAYLASPLLSMLFWKLHRYLTNKNYNYYIQDFGKNEISAPQPRRMILPAFAALGISYSISNIRNLANAIFVSESFSEIANEAETIVTSLAVLFILLLLSCFVVLLFTPMWLMQDKGLVCEFKTRPRMTADIEGVGNWYLKMLKGFAGISTVVAYIFTIFQTVEWYHFMLTSPPPGGFSMLIFLIPVAAVIVSPILALGPISIVYVVYEKSLMRNLVSLESKIKNKELSAVEIDLKKLT